MRYSPSLWRVRAIFISGSHNYCGSDVWYAKCCINIAKIVTVFGRGRKISAHTLGHSHAKCPGSPQLSQPSRTSISAEFDSKITFPKVIDCRTRFITGLNGLWVLGQVRIWDFFLTKVVGSIYKVIGFFLFITRKSKLYKLRRECATYSKPEKLVKCNRLIWYLTSVA